MIIQINDTIRIRVNSETYAVIEKDVVVKGGKTAGEIRTEVLGYYMNVPQACRGAIRLLAPEYLSENEVISLAKHAEIVDKIADTLYTNVKEVMK